MMEELRPGLWRWMTAHPEWKAGKDWPERVASIAVATGDGRLALIDPLVRDDSVWTWLAARGPIVVLLGNDYHQRSRDEVVRRTGATVLSPDGVMPPGIEAFPIAGLDGPETAYYLAPQRAVVFADAVLGQADGGVALAPKSWSSDKSLYARIFRAEVAKVAARPIDLVLVSHGEPILSGGDAALRRALDGPAWRPAVTS